MAIEKLIAHLGLNKTGFDSGIRFAEKQVNKFGTKMVKTLAGAFSIVAIAGMARQAMETAKNIDQLANRFNLTTDEVQLLQAESDKTGTSFSDLTKDAKKLEETLSRLRGGDVLFSREQVETLKNAKEIIDEFKNQAGVEIAGFLGEQHPGVRSGLQRSRGNPSAIVDVETSASQKAFIEEEARKKREAKARMAIINDALEIQKKADEISEKNRRNVLPVEEQITDLTKEREAIFKRETSNQVEMAQKQFDLAKNEEDLIRLSKTPEEKDKAGKGFGIAESAFGRIGAFTGAAAAASVTPGQAQQIQQLQKIYEAMVSKGIIVKDARR